jgi:hypothetical protein
MPLAVTTSGRLRRAAIFLFLTSLSFTASCAPSTAREKGGRNSSNEGSSAASQNLSGSAARILGNESVVFDWSSNACDRPDYPDAPVRAFRDYRGRVQLLISHLDNRRMVGPDLDHLTHRCAVIMRSRMDSHPIKFSDREWIRAIYTRGGRRIYALIHNEFQGHRHPGRCPSGVYQKCWYNAITLAVSRNGGRSFHRVRSTRLVATLPYRYAPDTGPYGVFGPSNIVYNRAQRHYYALFRVRKYRDQLAGVCVARTRRLSDATSWRAWDGTAFRTTFVNPYRKRRFLPSAHVCQPVANQQIQGMFSSLTFNTYFNQFILVGRAEDADKRRSAPGIYFSLSPDLINWTPRRLIMRAESQHTYRCGDRAPLQHPSLIDPTSTSRSFGTTGQRPYLYVVRLNQPFCRSAQDRVRFGPDRDLVRIPVEFSK